MNLPKAMRALQLRGIGRLDLVTLPVPAPRPDEVLIRTAATTICTSDLNDIASNPSGLPLPRVLGHEGAGVVAALGREVTGLGLGERVTAHPVIPCGACPTCSRGLPHLCERMGHLGADRGGTFAEYFAIRADRVRRVPDGLDLAVAALMEPVAVCLQALRRARLAEGERLVVAGDGPFGILIARLAFRRKPGIVVLVVGHHDFRMAHVPAAVHVHAGRVADVRASILEATDGAGADAAILAVGSAEAAAVCLQSLRPRGRLVLFSAVLKPAPLDLVRVHLKELEVLGACNDEDDLDEALACLTAPALRLAEVITHRIPFADWPRAFDLARNRHDEALKVALMCGTGC